MKSKYFLRYPSIVQASGHGADVGDGGYLGLEGALQAGTEGPRGPRQQRGEGRAVARQELWNTDGSNTVNNCCYTDGSTTVNNCVTETVVTLSITVT